MSGMNLREALARPGDYGALRRGAADDRQRRVAASLRAKAEEIRLETELHLRGECLFGEDELALGASLRGLADDLTRHADALDGGAQ